MIVSSLSQYDRGAIYQLLKSGLSHNQIATRLGVAKSTISYELKRVIPYNPVKAQHDANAERKHCGRHYALSRVKGELIEDHLKLTWSPEEIAYWFHFCTSSIYNWIYDGLINFSVDLLPDKNRRHRRKHERRGHFPITHSIEERPKVVDSRSTFGNWEVDTVLSSRGESKSCLATFVERKSRFLWAIKIPNRTSKSMALAMK